MVRNQHQEQRLKSVYIKDAGEEEITFSYVLTNINVQNICKTEGITYYINRQQTRYLAHIARQPNDTLAKRLLFNNGKSIKKDRLTLKQQLNNNNMTADNFY